MSMSERASVRPARTDGSARVVAECMGKFVIEFATRFKWSSMSIVSPVSSLYNTVPTSCGAGIRHGHAIKFTG